MKITNNLPGEYTCCLCKKPYPEDDIKFVGNDAVCFTCYEKEAKKHSGKCGICGAPLSNSDGSQCFSCRSDSFRDRENNTRGWIGNEK